MWRVLVILVLLAVLGGAAWLLRATPSDPSIPAPGTATGPPEKSPLPVETEPVGDAYPQPRPLPPVRPPTGSTPFVRRLEVGTALRELVDEVSHLDWDNPSTVSAVSDRLSFYVPYLLANDGYDTRHFPPRPGTSLPEKLQDALRFLTEPRRDFSSLRRAGAGSDDPLGPELSIRVWTADGRYPAHEIALADATLSHLAATARAPIADGFDVLASPNKGAEFFPHQTSPSWSVGTYFLRDRYCVLSTRLPPRKRIEVLEHELIHAYCRSFSERFTSHRLVSEGLAEYIRLYRPGDRGLNFPPDRLADNLAALRVMLDSLAAHGLTFDHLAPGALLEATAAEFYELRSLSYLMAQATMSYIGGAVIERSLSKRSDADIVAAVQRIDPEGFLEFIEEHGAGGDPLEAITVDDSSPPGDTPSRYRHRRATLVLALRGLGATGTLSAEFSMNDLRVVKVRRLRGPEALTDELQALIADRKTMTWLASDVSVAMDESVSSPLQVALRSLTEHRSPQTRREWVETLHQSLRSQHLNTRFLGMTDSPAPRRARSSARGYSALHFGTWLSASRGINAVVFVASRDEPARAELGETEPGDLFRFYRQRFENRQPAVGRILVVDLAPQTSDAAALARALSALSPDSTAVTLWQDD